MGCHPSLLPAFLESHIKDAGFIEIKPQNMKTKYFILIYLLMVACIIIISCSCSSTKRCYKGSDCSTFCKTIDDSVKYPDHQYKVTGEGWVEASHKSDVTGYLFCHSRVSG